MGYYSSGDGNPFLSGKSMREQAADLIHQSDGDCQVALLFLANVIDTYMAEHEGAHATRLKQPDPRQHFMPL